MICHGCRTLGHRPEDCDDVRAGRAGDERQCACQHRSVQPERLPANDAGALRKTCRG